MREPALFSESNARAHVSMLAGTIGSRAVGTPANERARQYVVDQLQLYGFEVRVQEADARRPELGRTARVANIIATLQGSRSEAWGWSRTTTQRPKRRARLTMGSAWEWCSRPRVFARLGRTGRGR